jgi:hypothetical protein
MRVRNGSLASIWHLGVMSGLEIISEMPEPPPAAYASLIKEAVKSTLQASFPQISRSDRAISVQIIR